jgi:hypothetical protein
VDAHGAAGAIFVPATPMVEPMVAPAVRRPGVGLPRAMAMPVAVPMAGPLDAPRAAARAGGAPLPLGVTAPSRAIPPGFDLNPAHSPHRLPMPPPQQQRRPSPTLPPLERRVTRAMAP